MKFMFPFRLLRIAGRPACRTPGRGGQLQNFAMLAPSDIRAFQRLGSDAFKQAFQQYSPGYQIADDDEKFQVSVDVPGIKSEDLSINIEEDGKVLTLSGSREKTTDGYSYSSKFSQSFYLDPAIDTDKISANLQNGVLVVSAPKDMKRVEDAIKKVPITELASEPVDVKTNASAVSQDEGEKETPTKERKEIKVTASQDEGEKETPTRKETKEIKVPMNE